MSLTAEQQAVVRSIRQLVDFWQITAEELRTDAPVVRQEPVQAVPSGPKYRHPHTGETWDGVGMQPQWLKDALIREGFLVGELRVPQSSDLSEADS